MFKSQHWKALWISLLMNVFLSSGQPLASICFSAFLMSQGLLNWRYEQASTKDYVSHRAALHSTNYLLHFCVLKIGAMDDCLKRAAWWKSCGWEIVREKRLGWPVRKQVKTLKVSFQGWRRWQRAEKLAIKIDQKCSTGQTCCLKDALVQVLYKQT